MNFVQKAVLVPYETYQRYIAPITEDPHSETDLKKYKSLSTKDPEGLLGSDVMEPPAPSNKLCKVSENPKQKIKLKVYKKADTKQRWLTS